MAEILSNPREIDNRIYVFPTSALKQDGRKINYFDFYILTSESRLYGGACADSAAYSHG